MDDLPLPFPAPRERCHETAQARAPPRPRRSTCPARGDERVEWSEGPRESGKCLEICGQQDMCENSGIQDGMVSPAGIRLPPVRLTLTDTDVGWRLPQVTAHSKHPSVNVTLRDGPDSTLLGKQFHPTSPTLAKLRGSSRLWTGAAFRHKCQTKKTKKEQRKKRETKQKKSGERPDRPPWAP